MLPDVISWPSRPASTYESVDLPEPFGPMMACTSPAAIESDSPFRISLPSTATYSSLISSMILLMPRKRALYPIPNEHACQKDGKNTEQSLYCLQPVKSPDQSGHYAGERPNT